MARLLRSRSLCSSSVVVTSSTSGSPREAKTRVAIDDANKSITFQYREGDVLRDFEVFQMKIEVVENGSNGSSVEYVKANEDVAPPHNYLLCVAKVSKGLDEYLCNN